MRTSPHIMQLSKQYIQIKETKGETCEFYNNPITSIVVLKSETTSYLGRRIILLYYDKVTLRKHTSSI